MQDTVQQLAEHLASFGIQFFNSASKYWSWGGLTLGKDLGTRLNELRKPLVTGEASCQDRQCFYDFISPPDIAGVVCSMKADAIRSSGSQLDSMLPKKGRVLDVGCSIGYLTTFYAIRSIQRHVVGCDNSGDSILRAVEEGQKRNIDNVEFIVANIQEELPAGIYDTITSSQTLSDVKNQRDVLKRIAGSLSPTGVFLSVEAFGTAESAASYIDDAAACGLALQSFEFVPFNDLGTKGAYPFFEFRHGDKGLSVDLDAKFQELLDSIQGRLLRSVRRLVRLLRIFSLPRH